MPDNDFVELLWENGPIVMQGQSNRQKKTSYIPSYNQKIHEDKDSRDQEITKIGQFTAMESHFAPSVPCTNMGLSTQDDDIRMNPWMSYSFEDPLSSELFSELTGVDRNNRSNLDNGNSSKINPVDINNKFSKMQHGQFQKYDVASNSKPLHANNGSGLTNFAHFSRPLSLSKVTNESLDRCKAKEKEKEKVKGEMKAICHQDVSTNKCINDKITNTILGENQVNVQSSNHGAEKCLEPIVASSSVCSGNSVMAASSDLKTIEKRKSREESEYQSDDIDDESTGLKKTTTGKGGSSAKRSRAAEVHNLSERRRRDRINEKMRALQELIPNCNKVDKASMLDEAIEYLKTLQLQVQMMAMGSGLCMSPMMLSPGMQHMRAPTMAHFSAMGVGMGMGMGLNYPMLDMNGIPISHMHTSQFPGFGISGHGQGMPLPQPSLFNPLSSLLPRGNMMNEAPLQVPELGTSLRFNDQRQQQQCANLEARPKTSNAGSRADTGHTSNAIGHTGRNAEKIE